MLSLNFFALLSITLPTGLNRMLAKNHVIIAANTITMTDPINTFTIQVLTSFQLKSKFYKNGSTTNLLPSVKSA